MPLRNRIWLGPAGQEQLLTPWDRAYMTDDASDFRAVERRALSGRLRWDTVYIKRRWLIQWQTMTSNDLNYLLSLQQLDQPLSLRIEQPDGSIEEYTVRMQPIGRRRRMLVRGDQWIWDGVSIELREI